MNIEEAKLFLATTQRQESRDHAFGDVEVYFMQGKKEVGGGYFGGGHADIWFEKDGENFSFKGDQAREIRNAIPLGAVGRNDETGPDTFTEGRTIPGLTKEAVRKELTGG